MKQYSVVCICGDDILGQHPRYFVGFGVPVVGVHGLAVNARLPHYTYDMDRIPQYIYCMAVWEHVIVVSYLGVLQQLCVKC